MCVSFWVCCFLRVCVCFLRVCFLRERRGCVCSLREEGREGRFLRGMYFFGRVFVFRKVFSFGCLSSGGCFSGFFLRENVFPFEGGEEGVPSVRGREECFSSGGVFLRRCFSFGVFPLFFFFFVGLLGVLRSKHALWPIRLLPSSHNRLWPTLDKPILLQIGVSVVRKSF